MAIELNWHASLVDESGAAAAGIKIDLQMHQLDAAKSGWRSLQTATTGKDGSVSGKVRLTTDAPWVPGVRLAVSGTDEILSATPEVDAGKAGVIVLDFGRITRLSQKRVISSAVLKARTVLGGVAGTPVVSTAVPKATVVTYKADLDKANANIKTLNKSLSDAKALADKRNTQLIELQQRIATTEISTQAKLKDLETARAEAGSLRMKLATAQGELDERSASLNREITMLRERADTVEAERKTQVEQLRARDDRIAMLEKSVTDLKARGPDLAGTATGDGVRSGFVNLGDFAATIGSQLHSIQGTLAKSAFAMGPVQVTARGAFDAATGKILLDKDALAKAEALSELQFSLEPTNNENESLNVRVPDVSQLTASAARRVLTSVGLRLKSSHGPASLASGGAAQGQAMLQQPAAGASAARGSEILVVFAQ